MYSFIRIKPRSIRTKPYQWLPLSHGVYFAVGTCSVLTKLCVIPGKRYVLEQEEILLTATLLLYTGNFEVCRFRIFGDSYMNAGAALTCVAKLQAPWLRKGQKEAHASAQGTRTSLPRAAGPWETGAQSRHCSQPLRAGSVHRKPCGTDSPA